MMTIRQIIPEGYCLSCQGCCRFAEGRSAWAVRLSAEEQQALGIQDTIVPSAADQSTGQCICTYFDSRQARCAVYYKRPFECQLYPFVMNRQGASVFLALDLNCPYAKAQYETQAMRDFISYLAGVCNSPAFVQTLRENPWLIQQYPAVLNIAAIAI
jgi:Fe-S-cluster containining protein